MSEWHGRGEARAREGKGRGKESVSSLSPYLCPLWLYPCSYVLVRLYFTCHGMEELAHRLFNQQLITLPHSTIVAAQFILTLSFIRNRGYYMVVQRCEISLRVLKRALVKYIFNTAM